MSKYEELENLAKATVRAVRNAGNDNDAFNMVLINLKSQDRISRESERQKIKKLLLEKGNGGGNWRRIIISIIK